jgi:ribosomal protein S18 acetylase RimI-like enzyme
MRVSLAKPVEINAIKKLVDKHKRELGFVLRATLLEGIRGKSVYVAREEESPRIIGLVHFRHKRDKTTKIYQICVDPIVRNSGVATDMLNRLAEEAQQRGQVCLLLKCPADLPANYFYPSYGFCLEGIHSGKQRRLFLWKYPFAPKNTT